MFQSQSNNQQNQNTLFGTNTTQNQPSNNISSNTLFGLQSQNQLKPQQQGLFNFSNNQGQSNQFQSNLLFNNPTSSIIGSNITTSINQPFFNNNINQQNNNIGLIGGLNQNFGKSNIPTTTQQNIAANNFSQNHTINNYIHADQDTLDIIKIATRNPVFFSDERDEVIRKLNLLCCNYGCSFVFVGRGYNAVAVTQKNYLCKFKLITYIPRFKYKDSDGMVTLDLCHSFEVFQNGMDNFLAYILQIVATKVSNNDVTLTIQVQDLQKMDENLTRITLFVNVKDNTGVVNRISAIKLLDILNDGINRELLEKQGVTRIDIQSDFSQDLEQHYRKYPPYGINPDVWNESFDNNPNPKLYIPYVLLGFQGVADRVQDLRNQSQDLMDNIKNISTKFNDNKSNYFTVNNKLTTYSNVVCVLLSRVLKLYCIREKIMRSGEPLIEFEEKFKIILKNMCTKIMNLQEMKNRLQQNYVEVKKGINPPINISSHVPSSSILNNIKPVNKMQSLEICDSTVIELLLKHLTNYNQILTKLIQSTRKNTKTISCISSILKRHDLL